MASAAGLEERETVDPAKEETPVERFRRIVVGPLTRAGFRKPQRFTVEEWGEALDELGAELGGRSGVELDELKRFLRAKGEGSRRSTWPSPVQISGYARDVFAKHVEATGGNSETDRQMVRLALGWQERHGAPPPPSIVKLERPSRLFMLLGSPGAPTLKELRHVGHYIAADVEAWVEAELAKHA